MPIAKQPAANLRNIISDATQEHHDAMQNMMRTIDPATENIVQLHVQIDHERVN